MNIRKTLLSAVAGTAMLGLVTPAQAQDLVMGTVMLVANTFCPRATMETQGQLLSIAQNTALFSLLGNTYGGDGITTFALPDLRGRAPIDWGQGPGLSNYVQGEASGAQTVTITINQMPAHNHLGLIRAVAGAPNSDNPANAALADFPTGTPIYNNTTAPNVNMAPGTLQTGITGNNSPVPILNPYLVLRYCIVTQGIYPSRG